MRLQVALDFTKLEDAIRVARVVSPHADILEAGTPLIKNEGMKAVKVLSSFDIPVMADMKAMDTGYLEVEMAAQAGASIVSVMGCAPLETIMSARDACNDHGVELLVDLMGVTDLENIRKALEAKPDYLLVHAGIDQQKAGADVTRPLKEVSRAVMGACRLAVAGGLDEKKVMNLRKVEDLDIVVVGGRITKSENPGEAARKIKEVLMSL